MEKFSGNSYSTHGHFRAELFVISFVLFIVAFIVFPKARGAYGKIKLNSAIDSAYSYKESVNNYYVSQLLFDNNFKLDGVYTISDGKLVFGEAIYNILISGNVPNGGYLDYENNVLKDGCIDINGYSVLVSNGDVVSAYKGSCELIDTTEVASNDNFYLNM